MTGITFLIPVAFILFFWILVVRPQGRRARELASMQDSLALGDEVVLTSGIFGAIDRLEDDRVGIEIAPGVSITVAKGAIGIVNPPVPDQLDPLDQHVKLDKPAQPDHLEIDEGADGATPEEKN